MDDKRKLQFRNNGSFRVLHLTDIQEGIHPRKDTLRLINALLAETMPDLVILTGDQIKGYSHSFDCSENKAFKKRFGY